MLTRTARFHVEIYRGAIMQFPRGTLTCVVFSSTWLWNAVGSAKRKHRTWNPWTARGHNLHFEETGKTGKRDSTWHFVFLRRKPGMTKHKLRWILPSGHTRWCWDVFPCPWRPCSVIQALWAAWHGALPSGALPGRAGASVTTNCYWLSQRQFLRRHCIINSRYRLNYVHAVAFSPVHLEIKSSQT